MVSGVGKIGEFDNFDYSDSSEWFYTPKSFKFEPFSGPDENFDEGSFLITLDHGKFIFFDGRTFDFTLENNHSCVICLRKNTELREVVTVATFQMPYDMESEELIRTWLDGQDDILNYKWKSLCSACLDDIQSVYDEINEDSISAYLL